VSTNPTDAGHYWYQPPDSVWTVIRIYQDDRGEWKWQRIGSSFTYRLSALSGTLGPKIERRGR
jgi:hypothetical protein